MLIERDDAHGAGDDFLGEAGVENMHGDLWMGRSVCDYAQLCRGGGRSGRVGLAC